MLVVHDGTANINKRNVINVKCVNCKNCVNYSEGYYYCLIGKELELIEECIANDDNMDCDLYVNDDHDDITERA